MTPRRLLAARLATLALLAGLVALAASARSLPKLGSPETTRQVTVFGVLATPDPSDSSEGADPRLKDVEPKLRKLVPGYAFRRLGVKSKRLAGSQALACPLGEGREAKVEMLSPVDDQGKVKLRFTLTLPKQPTFVDEITLPPNQLVLVDRMLPNKERILVGLAAR